MFEWQVAFLGIASLVRDFTKMLKPVKAFLQAHGVPSFVYIDDFLYYGPSLAACQRQYRFIQFVLESAGWVENPEKARGPGQRGVFLGLEIDTIERVVRTPEDKMELIQSRFKQLLKQKKASSRQVAGAYGAVCATLLATGPILHLLCRDGYA